MSEFRKQPVKVEAIQWTGSEESYKKILSLRPESSDRAFNLTLSKTLFIRTLEGSMQADIGDWIIKGVAGEVYPCKHEIFKETYTPSGKDHCNYCRFEGDEHRPCDAYERCCFEWKEGDIISPDGDPNGS